MATQPAAATPPPAAPPVPPAPASAAVVWSPPTPEERLAAQANPQPSAAVLKSLRRQLRQLLVDTALGRRIFKDVRDLTTRYPSLATMTTELDVRLPLHEAVYSRASLDVVKAVLSAYPEAASIPVDSSGPQSLPLHLAAQRQYGVEGEAVVDLLLQAYPAAIMRQDGLGRVPLHCAAQYQGHPSDYMGVVQRLLRAAPEAAMVADNTGQLPLHVAAQYSTGRAGQQLVQLLLQAAPQAALVPDHKGCLPLHVVATPSPGIRPVGIVEELFAAAPEAALKGNLQGNLPLHLAARNRSYNCSTPEVIEALIRLQPQALTVANSDGDLPIHVAAAHQCDKHGLLSAQALIRAAPATLLVANHQGSLPLHLAAENSTQAKGIEVLRAILRAAPTAVLRRDAQQQCPLHLALQKYGGYVGFSVTDLLLKAAPQTALCIAADNKLPLTTAYELKLYSLFDSLAKATQQHLRSAVRRRNTRKMEERWKTGMAFFFLLNSLISSALLFPFRGSWFWPGTIAPRLSF